MPTDGGVVDVVVGGNHSQVEWRQIHLILYRNTLQHRNNVHKYITPCHANDIAQSCTVHVCMPPISSICMKLMDGKQ